MNDGHQGDAMLVYNAATIWYLGGMSFPFCKVFFGQTLAWDIFACCSALYSGLFVLGISFVNNRFEAIFKYVKSPKILTSDCLIKINLGNITHGAKLVHYCLT